MEGLVGLPKFSLEDCVRLADYGGKMAVLWEVTNSNTTIWCAVIELDRRTSCEIWGKVDTF